MKISKLLLSTLFAFGLLMTACGSNETPKENSSSGNTESSSIEHQHRFSELHEELAPTFLYEGHIAYYECLECHKYFDINYQEVDSIVIPKLSNEIVLLVNEQNKGDFTITTLEENTIVWDINNINLSKDDVISLASKADNTVTYSYFPNTNTNITEEFKVHNDADNATINVTYTLNGLYVSISGFEYDGVVIKINDTEYPMNQVTYREEDKQTYIYGYAYIKQNDIVTVIDKDNDIIYDYDDLENDTLWNTFDFHKGDNDEIIFDYQARYGFEFDRGGDKKISIVKTFAPNATNKTAISFEAEKDNVEMVDNNIPQTDPSYDETLWYIKHEAVINSEDIVSYIQTNGLHIYSAHITLEINEKFNIADITNSSVIKGDHLVSLYCNTVTGNFAIEGDYIKSLKGGAYDVVYMPSCSSIVIYESATTGADAYLMVNGESKPLNKDINNVVTYENLEVKKNDYIVFADSAYNTLTITLSNTIDASICHKMDVSNMTMVYFDKAGTFTLHLDLTSLVLSIDVIEIAPVAMTGGRIYFSKAGNKNLVQNPDNSDELCVKDVQISDISGYAVIYDQDSNMITPTLSSGSEQYAVFPSSTPLFYITQTGTFDFYINKTTHVLRIEKQ